MDKFETWWDKAFKLAPGEPLYAPVIGEPVEENQMISSLANQIKKAIDQDILLSLRSLAETSRLEPFIKSSETVLFDFDEAIKKAVNDGFLTPRNTLQSPGVSITAASETINWIEPSYDSIADMKTNLMANQTQLEAIEDRLVGKIEDYFNCVVIPEINNRIATKVERLPSGEHLQTPEKIALDAYTRAMKVVE